MIALLVTEWEKVMINNEMCDVFDSKTGKESSGPDALQRLREEIQDIRESDLVVGLEMNKFRLVCDAPPVTPRCHIVDEPPDPAHVNEAMNQMRTAKKDLQAELDALRPSAPAGGKRFEQGFVEISKQSQALNQEIDKLVKLTGLSSHYDRAAITKETETIDRITLEMEKTRRKMQKDYGN